MKKRLRKGEGRETEHSSPSWLVRGSVSNGPTLNLYPSGNQRRGAEEKADWSGEQRGRTIGGRGAEG